MSYARPGVYISERLLPPAITEGASADAAGAVCAPLEKGPETVTKVSSWYEFTKYFGGYNESYPATFQIGAFFQNGGRELYVKRILAASATKATIALVTSGPATVATATAKNAGTDGNNLRVKVEAGTVASTYTLSVYQEGIAGTSSSVADDVLLEKYDNVVFTPSTSADYAITIVNAVSQNITLAIGASPAGAIVSGVYPLATGSNGSAVTTTDYVDYKGGGGSVLADFESIDRSFVLFYPGIHTLTVGSTNTVTVLYTAAQSWADTNNAFLVADTASGLTVTSAMSFAAGLASTSNTAVYFPNVYTADPVGRSSQSLRLVGPSGAVAGLYLATDASIGVFKSPAGLGASLKGVVATELAFTSANLDTMNSGDAPINPIRNITGSGFVVMGARTLLQDGTANKYVNMRRSLIYIKRELKILTEFALFENNDEKLWARINTALGYFLNQYRNQGGLRGATAAQSYYVRCNAENNTATSIENGEVHIQVGVALQYPAEFIVIDLSQKTLN